MTDPRIGLQDVCARWLRLLAQARADAALLTVAEHDLATTASRSDDPAVDQLAATLRERRAASDQVIAAIEHGIAVIRAAIAAIGDAYVARLIDRVSRN